MSVANKPTKNRAFTIIIAVILALIISGFSFLGGFFTSCVIRGQKVNTLSQIMTIMEKVGYVYDPVTGEKRELTEDDYANALVNAFLDDYSRYYSPEEYLQEISQSMGNYTGIGIGFYDDDLFVDVVTGNSPAYKAGLRAGDKLVLGSCDEGNYKVLFTSAYDVLDFINYCGEDELITFRVESKGELTMQRQAYVASYVSYYDSEKIYEFKSEGTEPLVATERVNDEYGDITDDKTAYIKFDLFESDAAIQLGLALNYMQSRGRTKLIFDLRDNGGGYLHILTDVASYFIKNNYARNSVVAYSIDKNGNKQAYVTTSNNYKDFITSMCVLANKNTASASECLIGALIHYGDLITKEKIVLEKDAAGDNARTYGKGIMQTTYLLTNGGAFKLTTAKTYWPDAETCIHGVGFKDGTKAIKGNAIYRAQQLL